ncbi:MAG TPA: hypothetical protein VKA19_13505 [Alphaproteobacteria bacterium]|nr:hypothetical protein [Alphaproteobacteria bacterium]
MDLHIVGSEFKGVFVCLNGDAASPHLGQSLGQQFHSVDAVFVEFQSFENEFGRLANFAASERVLAFFEELQGFELIGTELRLGASFIDVKALNGHASLHCPPSCVCFRHFIALSTTGC